MGLFSGIKDAIGGVLKPVAGAIGGFAVGGVPGAIAGGLGAWLQQQGMEDAAKAYEEGTDEQKRAMEAAFNRQDLLTREGLAAYEKAAAQSGALLEKAYADSGPARRVMEGEATADPALLRPGQQRTLDDLSKGFQASLAKDGLRGAGEAGIAAGFDTLARSRERMVESNRASKIDAASMLSRAGYETLLPRANLAAEGGRQTLSTLTGMAGSDPRRQLATIAGDNAVTQGNLKLAEGNMWADTVGTIAGMYGGYQKEFDPSRRFATATARV